MAYFTIHYTAEGQPYIIEKNYGHKAEKEDSSSHWTWHITGHGVKHLKRGNVISPGKMPAYINDDELEDLKAYNMLARANGERIGYKGLYPSDDPAWRQQVAEQRELSKVTIPPTNKRERLPTTQPHVPKSLAKPQPPTLKIEVPPEEPPKGLWASLRSIFGKR